MSLWYWHFGVLAGVFTEFPGEGVTGAGVTGAGASVGTGVRVAVF